MYKCYLIALYSLLFSTLFYISGCQIAGSGFGGHSPPKKIICDTPWTITMKFSVVPVDPKEKYGKLSERYKDVAIHIRDSIKNNFDTVPMVIESVSPAIGKMQFNANMKAIPCNASIEYVEYYIDFMFDHNHHRTELYRVPVNNN